MLALKAENISKQYRLGQVGTGTISHDLNRFWHQIRGKEDPYLKIGETNDRTVVGESEYVWSLKDINFEIEQGDAVGIIGRNGAGKSTLLKLLSKVTKPTTGKIHTKGRIASLLEVGTGFHPEMTGRENIYLNGAILGMTRKEIKRKFDEIVDFSGVERYIDTPVKRYSSGMYVRLAFAVAAHLESEILIVDEVLAVGDAEFQKKCLGKMGDVSKGEGRTVLFVSHDLNAVSQICNTGILLNNGLVEYSGLLRETISTYLNADNNDAVYRNLKDNGGKKMYIKQIEVLNDNGNISKEFVHNEPINLKFYLSINEKISNSSFFVTILDSRKRRVFSCERQSVDALMTLTIEAGNLVRGNYSIHAFINQPKIAPLDVAEDVCKFTVIDAGSYLSKHGEYDYGSVFGRYTWK
ncbi:ABC transporter ATP-binding protein [Halpernia sp. GG3]